MTRLIKAKPIPLEVNADGVVRVGGTWVLHLAGTISAEDAKLMRDAIILSIIIF
jgi:hypothetical protein